MAKSRFTFKSVEGGYTVLAGRRELGTIMQEFEPSGRYAFRLGVDSRKNPRLFRGKERAAEALQAIDDLIKRHGKSMPQLVVAAWDEIVATAPRSGAE